MVSPRTTANAAHNVAAPYRFPLSESHALVVEVVDALGGIRDGAHLQHCLYLAQEFRLLRRRRYWFASDGSAAGLPYSYILDDHMRTLMNRGVIERDPAPPSGRPALLRVCHERGAPPPPSAAATTLLAALGPDDIAAFAGAVFALSRRGRHPVHQHFHGELRAMLRADMTARQEHGVDSRVERIAAACLRLSSPTLESTLLVASR